MTSGDWRTIDEIGADIATAVPGAKLVLEGKGYPDGYTLGRLKPDAAARDFGFRAQVGFVDGVKKYADWLAQQSKA